MLTQNERKKCPSYAIQMMLKLSNTFIQMSDICRNAVIQFSKDISLHQQEQKVSKYRITQSSQQRISLPLKTKKQEHRDKLFEKIRTRKTNILPQNTFQTKLIPKQLRQLLSNQPRPRSVKIKQQTPQIQQKYKMQYKTNVEQKPKIQQKKKIQQKSKIQQKAKILQKTQNPPIQVAEEKKEQLKQTFRPKDPILLQKNETLQPLGPRNHKSRHRLTTTKLPQQDQQLSSEPSDYKARSRRKRSSEKNRKPVQNAKKSKAPPNEFGIKPPLNSYMLYYHEMRKKVQQQSGQTKIGLVSHQISKLWANLNNRQKNKYIQLYNTKKQNYKKLVKQKRQEQKKKEQQKGNSIIDQKAQKKPIQKLIQLNLDEQNDFDLNESEEIESNVSQKNLSDEQNNVKRQFLKVKRPTKKQADTGNENESSSGQSQSSGQSSGEGGQQNSQSSVPVPKKQRKNQQKYKDSKSEKIQNQSKQIGRNKIQALPKMKL